MITTSDGVIPSTIITTFPSDHIMEGTWVATVVIIQVRTTAITRHTTVLTVLTMVPATVARRKSISVGLG